MLPIPVMSPGGAHSTMVMLNNSSNMHMPPDRKPRKGKHLVDSFIDKTRV